MDINRVRYLNIFAETGSLVRASEILHISQPALSKALRLLESEVGIRLLQPEGRGLRLTDAGVRFRDATRPILSEWLAVAQKIREQEIWRPSRIGSFEVFTTYFLALIFKNVDLSSLEVHELGPGRMEQAVSQGKMDLAITYLPVPTAGVEFIEVAKIRMGVFGQKKFEGEQFSDLPFVIPILPAEGMPSKIIGLDGWPDHIIQRKILYRVTMMESALELCREGHAVSFLPEFIVHLHNKRMLADYRLQELKCALSASDRRQSVFIIRRNGSKETTMERQLAKSLRSLK